MKKQLLKNIILMLCIMLLPIWYLWADAGRNVSFDIIYPPFESKLKFNHMLHSSQDCLICHSGASESEKVADRLLPNEATCKACHNNKIRQTVNEKGDKKRCGFCHADYDIENKSRPSRVYWPKARINFSHKKHVLGMIACETCHKGQKLSTNSSRHLPKEADCLACHKEWKNNGDCNKCHAKLPSGLLQTSFDGFYLVPLKGRLNHQRNWNDRHKEEAVLKPKSCNSCHQQNFCNKCHDGVLKPMKIHPEDYVTMHPSDARKSQNRCSSCHRYQSFCTDCHTKLGLTKKAETKTDRTIIHPKGFGSCNPGATHHSFQAKRSLSACISCHREEDCIACHKGGGAGKCGVNIPIHGHMSQDKLSRMKAKNGRVCAKCHD